MMMHKCVRCRRNGANVISNGKFFCGECAPMFGTCAMCEHGQKCNFNNNPAPIPKVVTQRIRQETEMGIVEQIIQIPNPKRIKAFCIEETCICCEQEEKPRCLRQFGTCRNYKEIEF